MKPIEIVALIGAIVGLLGAIIDLITKLIRKKAIFNTPIFWVFLSLACLGGVFFFGISVGKDRYNRPNDNVPPYPQTTDMQEGISDLEKTIDFLKGKYGKSSEKIAEYENRLKIPSKGRVILFEHVNYKGHACYITPDDDVADLNLYGFGNSVSSIKVERDVQARVYSNINYSGSSLLIDSDMPSLMDRDWNDKILSISVEPKTKN